MTTQFYDVTWEWSTVSGASLRDVAAALEGLAEAGHARWSPQFSYEGGDGDVAASVAVTVGQEITLPNWDGRATASDAEGAEWDRFLSELQAHEQGHLDLAVQYLGNLDERMVGQPISQLQEIFDGALNDLQAASDAYDASTDHGRNTGTIISVDVDTPDQ